MKFGASPMRRSSGGGRSTQVIVRSRRSAASGAPSAASRGSVVRGRRRWQVTSASSGSSGLAWNDAIATRSVRSPWVTDTRRVDIERPVAHAVDGELERLVGRAGLHEVGVQASAGPCRRPSRPRPPAPAPRSARRRPGRTGRARSAPGSGRRRRARAPARAGDPSSERVDRLLERASVRGVAGRVGVGGLGVHGAMATTRVRRPPRVGA